MGIKILVTIDKNYLVPLRTMLLSFAEHHRGIKTDLYIAHSALTEEDIAFLQVSEEITVHSIPITESYFKDTPVIERLPEESFYRLLAFRFLPEEADRCLYLDPDIIIRRSLLPLWELEMGDSYIAAAAHLHGFADYFNKARLGITEQQERYINSGVMLMNLAAIRRDFTAERILAALEEHIQQLWLGDQDLANLIFGETAILIDERIYNLDERTLHHYRKSLPLSAVEADTAIIHYNGKHKPWLEGYKGRLDVFYPEVEKKGPAPTGKWKEQMKAIHRITRATPQQKAMLFAFLAFLLLCCISYVFFGKELMAIVSEPAILRNWLDRFGIFDEVIFILIRAAQTVVKFLPAEPLEIGSGYAWGAVPGMLYCVAGNMLGTLVILWLTKRYGQKVVRLLFPTGSMRVLSLFQNSDKVYALLFFLYLIPGSPKDGFTYLAGLLPIKTVPFMVITGIARIPSVLSSTLCGSALADKQYLISALIFAATILLAIAGGLIYRHYYIRKK